MNNQTTTVKCSVNVYNPIKLKSFNLNKTNISLQPGKSTILKRVINPTNATIIKVAYATSNKKVATVYSNPDLGIDEYVILKFYATDFNHKAYLTDNYTEKFDIEVNVKGKISKMTINAGESSVNLGKMSVGEY